MTDRPLLRTARRLAGAAARWRPPLARVVDVGADVRVEHGTDPLTRDGWAPDRVAVLAQWSPDERVPRSTRVLVRELATNGYEVLVVSTSPAPGPLEWGPDGPGDGVVVLRRPNTGYDFGSWAVGLHRHPQVRSARRVLLLNDSMVGPFAPLAPLLADFDGAVGTDVWGLTDTLQFGHHLQSYVLGFRDGVLADRPLRAFWDGVRLQPDKQQIIFAYEIGLSRLLAREGYAARARFGQHLVVEPGLNPVILGWEGLLRAGMPFVKRQLLTEPEVAPDAHRVPEVVRELYGEELGEWTT